jgi:hypothetical protein
MAEQSSTATFNRGYFRRLMQMRDLLPRRDLVVETSWPPDVAANELATRIGKGRFFGGGHTLFVGDRLNEREFRFSRRISYRNSFLPVIRVVIEDSDHGGSRVRVRMRLHAFVLAAMALYMTVATFIGLPLGFVLLSRRDTSAVIPLAMPVFGATLTTVSFAVEAQKAERLLRDIFAGAPKPGAQASLPEMKWR